MSIILCLHMYLFCKWNTRVEDIKPISVDSATTKYNERNQIQKVGYMCILQSVEITKFWSH